MAAQLNLFELVAMAIEPVEIKNTLHVPVVEETAEESTATTLEVVVEKSPVSGVRVFKKGKYLGLKALDAKSNIILTEFLNRLESKGNCSSKIFGIPGDINWSIGVISLREIIEHTVEASVQVQALKSMGVDLVIDDQLTNYLNKERRRWEIERTPYRRSGQVSDFSLFERCVTGLVLHCTRDFLDGKKKIFEQGKDYLIVDITEDGESCISIGTTPLIDKQVTGLDKKSVYNWTQFDATLEDHFEEQNSVEELPDMTVRYPDMLEKAQSDLEKLGLPLYKHVAIDAAQCKNRRRVFNAYPMRMAKTSFAIATNELWGSKSVAVISPTIARHFWVREFNRMGFKEGVDFIQIKKLSDTKHPAKYHLFTIPWLRREVDSNAKARYKGRTILGMETHRDEKGNVEWENVNYCPHCKHVLYNREKTVTTSEAGAVTSHVMSTYRGYRCVNTDCSWKVKGTEKTKAGIHATPWSVTKARKANGGYINWELINHANCSTEDVKGRMCSECKTADAEWTPGRYKRLKKAYNCLDLDEAHDITNKTSQSYKAVAAMRAKRKIDLSGTPMGKSPLDIFWPFHQCFGGGSMLFPYSQSKGRTEFADRYCSQVTLEKDAGSITDSDGKVTVLKKTVKKIIPFVKDPPAFWKFTGPLMIRRTYSDELYRESLKVAGMHMAKSDPQLFPVTLNPEQAQLMLKSIEDFKNAFGTLEKEAKAKDGEVNMGRVQNMPQMITLRILATCPEYLNQKLGKEVYKGKPGGAKMTVIRKIVEDRLKQGKKVVILSDFHAMQKAVADEFSENGVLRFMPGWDETERSEAFDTFESDSKYRIAVAGTQNVRQSADLSAADVCICTDLLWSPVRQSQAWSRILTPTKRERTCEILLLCATGTIDVQIFDALYQAFAGTQQALDRAPMDKRVRKVDAYWFRDRILETERYLREFLSENEHERAPAMPKGNFMEISND